MFSIDEIRSMANEDLEGALVILREDAIKENSMSYLSSIAFAIPMSFNDIYRELSSVLTDDRRGKVALSIDEQDHQRIAESYWGRKTHKELRHGLFKI